MPEQVTVSKSDILKILKKNRKTHRTIFEEAVEGYKSAAIREIEKRVKQIKDGKLINIAVALPVPEDHTSEYDRAIKMVEMEVSDTITLHDTEFAELIMDDWHWKKQWVSSNSKYSMTAMSLSTQ